MIDIATWAESPTGFYVDRYWDSDRGRWVLRPGPIRLAQHHRDILRHCFTPDSSGKMPYDTVCICEAAKSGKSALGALVAEYFALHVEPGPGNEIYLIANKQDQAAGKTYKSLKESIESNPYLHVSPDTYQTRFRSGTTIKAIPSNAKTEAGSRYTLAVFDEPWGIMSELEEALVAEFKVDPTRNISVRCFIGYGGYEDSQVWRELLENGQTNGEPVLTHITNSDGTPACYALGRLFVYWSDHPRQPWQTSEWLESFRRIERLTASQEGRMIRCEFVGIAQPFVPSELWRACLDPNLKPLPPMKEVPLYVGVDAAVGAGGDDAAVIAVYEADHGQICVAWHKIWRGSERRIEMRIDKTIEPYILAQSRVYNLAFIGYDPRYFTTAGHRLRDEGLPAVKIVQSLPVLGPLGQGLFNLIQDGRLRYYDHPDLTQAAAGAVARDVATGLHIKKSSRLKIDLMVALSFAAGQVTDLDPAKLEYSAHNPFFDDASPGQPVVAGEPLRRAGEKFIAWRQRVMEWKKSLGSFGVWVRHRNKDGGLD